MAGSIHSARRKNILVDNLLTFTSPNGFSNKWGLSNFKPNALIPNRVEAL
jgi:hypothetical protein